jgi:CTP synthase
MQVALIEFARNVAGMENANSTEFVPDCKYPVVALITEWRDEDGNVEVALIRAISAARCASARSSASWLNSLVRQLYGEPTITERHRHRYEVNNMLLKPIENAGLRIAGRSGMISWSRSSRCLTIRGSSPVSSIRSLLRRRVMAIRCLLAL